MSFYLWIILMSPAAVGRMVAGMVREGFKVSPLAASQKLFWEGDVSCLLALMLEGTVVAEANGTVQGKVLNAVKRVAEKNQLMHHAIVIHHVGGNSTWTSSNIELPKPKKEEPQTALERITKAGEEEIG